MPAGVELRVSHKYVLLPRRQLSSLARHSLRNLRRVQSHSAKELQCPLDLVFFGCPPSFVEGWLRLLQAPAGMRVLHPDVPNVRPRSVRTELVPLHVDDVSLSLVATTGRVGHVETTLNDVVVEHVVKVLLVHHLITVGVLVVVVQGRLHARQLITILHTEIAIVAVLSLAAFVIIVASVIVVGVVVDVV